MQAFSLKHCESLETWGKKAVPKSFSEADMPLSPGIIINKNQGITPYILIMKKMLYPEGTGLSVVIKILYTEKDDADFTQNQGPGQNAEVCKAYWSQKIH